MKTPVCTFCKNGDRKLIDAYPGRAYICHECAQLATRMFREDESAANVIHLTTTAQGTGMWRA